MTNVVLVGSGAREHCLAEALVKGGAELYAYMQTPNPGIRKLAARTMLGRAEDVDAAVRFAKESNATLALIGPEAPLAEGIVDALEREGVRCVGPTREMAQLESSKGFTRQLLEKHGIDASPRFKRFTSEKGMADFLKELGAYAVKPDGLTGGKGVKLSGEHLSSHDAARAYCREVLGSHPAVIIEEKLEGEEFSLQTLTDGKAFVHFPVVQDHKRVGNGDTGPNTGGMGSYADSNFLLPFLDRKDVEAAQRITEQVADALHAELGGRYKGVLYGGFMKTAAGIKLIEYNARFGDPETMNVIPILKTDFLELCTAVAEGTLGSVKTRFMKKATVCKYVVPAGYPENPRPGEMVLEKSDAATYYAAVEERNGKLHTTTSRAVAFVGMGNTIADAERIAEEAARQVKGAVHHRSDIGTAALVNRRVEHMRHLLAPPLYKPKDGPMRVASLMSGEGTNLRRMLEKEKALGNASPFHVALVFTDTKSSNAEKIADEYGICYACNDLKAFYAAKGAKRSDMRIREQYDRETAELLRREKIDVVALCGYNSILTGPVHEGFLTLNVHPADLTKTDAEGKRKFAGVAGVNAVKAALRAGEKELRSTVHIVTEGVDEGRILAVSQPVRVTDRSERRAADYLQQLKEKGDWVVYPETMARLAEGTLR